MNNEFAPIISLIQESRTRALQQVNAELVNLYWQVGAYVSRQVAAADWGDKTIQALADYIQQAEPENKGFTRRGLYRMKQFYETYKDAAFLQPGDAPSRIVSPPATQTKKGKSLIVSPSVTQMDRPDIRDTVLIKISWTNHLIILSRTATADEKEFYLRLAAQERLTKRELDRQITSGLFERVALSKAKLPASLKDISKGDAGAFKDRYVFEFLNLPEPHNERDLQKAIIQNLKTFLLEFSRDFAFIGEEVPVQVGNKDFSLDLLFFNRALNCLVAIELKVVDFVPEHLGKLNFYLEALDRDVKKQHENPSIGILLCKAKDDEVVEYSLSRQLSPAMVSQYQLQLPDKKLLQTKLHEFFEINEPTND